MGAFCYNRVSSGQPAADFYPAIQDFPRFNVSLPDVV
jgi:hypothetical protein